MTKALTDYDEALLEFATEREAAYLRAVNEHRSVKAAARALGVADTTVGRALNALEARASAKRGYNPKRDLVKPVADGFVPVGHSTLYDHRKPGAPAVMQWVKTTRDSERQEQIVRETIRALVEDVKGIADPVPAPAGAAANLLTVYPMGDPHFGMYAWAEEAGDKFDLAEAVRVTRAAVDRLVAAAPPAATAIVLPLGDIFHADDRTNRTPKHKHPLDVSGRYGEILRAGVQTFRYVVSRALTRHSQVIMKVIGGNHDPHASWALSEALAAFFERDPRVIVDRSPSKFWYYRHGQVLIGATHGDTVRHEQLLGVMAADRAADWGETQHRYWYTGHVHHQRVTELPGVVCESFRTLAAKDAHAHGHGYRAGRDMRAIVHHTRYGEVERLRCDIGMLEDDQ